MAYTRDESDDDDDRGVSRGGSSRSSKGHNGHGDAKGLDTTKLVGEDGTFFGFKLNSEHASMLNGIAGPLKLWLRRTFQDKGEEYAQQFAQEHMQYKSAAEVAEFSNKVGVGIGLLTVFSDQVADVGTNIASTIKSMNDLSRAQKPVRQADGQSAGLEAIFSDNNNAVIKNARAKIRGIFMARNIQTAVKAIGNIPQILLWNEEEKSKRVDRRRQNALKSAIEKKNPDELVKLMEEEMGAGTSIHAEEAREKIWSKYWKSRQEKYNTAYKEFEDANKNQIKQEFFKEIGFKSEVPETIDSIQYAELKKVGLDSYYRQEYVAGNQAGEGTYHLVKNTHNEKRSASGIKSIFKKKMDMAIVDKTKAEYVRQFGALDDTWKAKLDIGVDRYSRRNAPEVKTIRERDYERLTKAFDDLHGISKPDAKLKKEDEHGNKQLKETIYTLAGSMGGDFLSKLFSTKNLEKYRKEIALDQITYLSSVVEKAKKHDETLDSVPPREGSHEKGDPPEFAKYIHEIFQQNQRDCGKSEIGERYFKRLKDAHWKDSEIQQLNDDDLNPYEFAIKHLSKQIKDHRMDALALITFVGDSKRKIVRESGKSFGPTNIGGGDAKVKAEIGKQIEQFSAKLRAHNDMTTEQVSQAMSDFTFSSEDIKATFTSTSVSSEEKAFLLMVIESHISDAKVIRNLTGLDDKALENLRKESEGRFAALMDAGVLALAEIAEKTPDRLHALDMTEEEIDVIKTISCKIEKGGKGVVEREEKEERQALETSVVNAAMSLRGEKDSDGPGFWQRLVSKSHRKIDDKPHTKNAADGDEMEVDNEPPKKHKTPHRADHANEVDREMDGDEDVENTPSYKTKPNGRHTDRAQPREPKPFAKQENEDKSMLQRLAARKPRDDSSKPSFDRTA